MHYILYKRGHVAFVAWRHVYNTNDGPRHIPAWWLYHWTMIHIIKYYKTFQFLFYINDCQWYFESLLENKAHVKTILKALQLSLSSMLLVLGWVSNVIALFLHGIALHYYIKSTFFWQHLDKIIVDNFGFLDYWNQIHFGSLREPGVYKDVLWTTISKSREVRFLLMFHHRSANATHVLLCESNWYKLESRKIEPRRGDLHPRVYVAYHKYNYAMISHPQAKGWRMKDEWWRKVCTN